MNLKLEIVERDLRQQFGAKLHSANHFIALLITDLSLALKIIFVSKTVNVNNFLEYLRKIVWNCLPIATLTISASALVYSIHVAPEFSVRGLNIYLGGLIALAMVREGVPVLASLAIVTQFCSGMTAQIASMKITEQLDAMKIFKVYPYSYFLSPMLLAGIIGFPVLILICSVIGLVVSFYFSNVLINITSSLYISSIQNSLCLKDIFLALTKAVIFGFSVMAVSYVCGVQAKGGSKAVGDSTKLCVVINFALIIILDYIITALWI